MTKDGKINIKLEVCRDKISGKLSIMTHFNSNAPNVFKDKDSYLWMPTAEEKDLINEAFGLMPIDADYVPSGKSIPGPEGIEAEESIPRPEEIEEEKSIPEPVIEEEIKPTPKNQPTEDEKKPTDFSPLEKPDESDVFEVTDQDIKTDDLDKDIDKEIEVVSAKVDEQTTEESKSDESETEKKKEDEGIIVEADVEAIDAALKKHTEKDKSIVEADEQTIIDRVLSQKKKGKWSRR